MKKPHEITQESVDAFDRVDELEARLADAEKLAGPSLYQDPEVLALRAALTEAHRKAALTVNMEPL